jgi:hypothetical protein
MPQVCLVSGSRFIRKDRSASAEFSPIHQGGHRPYNVANPSTRLDKSDAGTAVEIQGAARHSMFHH